jgi:hypothetical protein
VVVQWRVAVVVVDERNGEQSGLLGLGREGRHCCASSMICRVSFRNAGGHK